MKKSPSRVLSRFIRIRGMRYRNYITEGHTFLSLSLFNIYPLTIQFSSSGNTHLTTRKYRIRELFSFTPYFRNYTKTVCCKSSASKSFWKQFCPNAGASVITPGSQKEKTRRTDGSNKESECVSISIYEYTRRWKLSQCGMKMRGAVQEGTCGIQPFVHHSFIRGVP